MSNNCIVCLSQRQEGSLYCSECLREENLMKEVFSNYFSDKFKKEDHETYNDRFLCFAAGWRSRQCQSKKSLDNFSEYEKEVKRTRPKEITKNYEIINYALGLSGECGEAVEIVKKYLFHPSGDLDHLLLELGDLLWYLTSLANVCGFSLEEIATVNVTKLRNRYPDGFPNDFKRKIREMTNKDGFEIEKVNFD